MKALEYLISRPLLVTPTAAEMALSIVLRESDKPLAVEMRGGKPTDSEGKMTVRDGVATIEIVGPIFRYADYFTELCGGVTVEAVARDLQRALDNPNVRAVCFSIDSPGGEATGIAELAAHIRAADSIKPTCAYIAGMGCSAAYWLASACREVVCDSTAELGSIGVVCGYTVRADKPGTKSYQFVSSQSPDKRPDLETEHGRAVIQTVVDDLADVFVSAVAKYRGTTAENVLESFGKGGTLIGQKAVDVGMADRLGSYEDVISELSGRKARTSEASNLMSLNLKTAQAEASQDSAPPVIPFDQTLEYKAMAAKIASQDSALERLAKIARDARTDAIKAQATSFVQAEFSAGRIVPAESDALKALFVQLATDDDVSPLAAGTRTEALRTLCANRPKHALTREQVSGDALPAELRVLGSSTIASNAGPVDPNAVRPDKIAELEAKLPAHLKALLTPKNGK